MDTVHPNSFDGRVLKVLQTKLDELQAALSSEVALSDELKRQFDREDQKLKDLEPVKSQQIAKQDVTRESLKIVFEKVQEARADLATTVTDLQDATKAKEAKSHELRHAKESTRRMASATKQISLVLDQHKREIKRHFINRQKLDSEYPVLCISQDGAKAACLALQEECDSNTTLTTKLRHEVETLLNTFIKQDDLEKDRNEELMLTREQRLAMEKEAVDATRQLRTWTDREASAGHSLQRLRRQVKLDCMRYKSKLEDIRVQEIEKCNLEEDAEELQKLLSKLSVEFETSRAQRNAVVSSMHTTAQQVSDLRRRVNNASEELKVLNGDQEAKALQIKTAEISVEDQLRARNTMKAEVVKTQVKCRDASSSIEKNVGSIEKQTRMVSQLESRIKSHNEEARRSKEQVTDLTVALVANNDDICILSEELEVQTNTKASLEHKLLTIQDDIKLKTLDLADFSSSIHALKLKIPEISGLHAERMHLQAVVTNLISTANDLSAKIENPESGEIVWRCIGGRDLDLPTLAAKARVLQNRIDVTKESRFEREAELTRLMEEVHKVDQANQENISEQARLASQVNTYQAQSNRIMRKLHASVSELSLYQSKSSTLNQAVAEMTVLVDQARDNLSNGLAPTEDADAKLQKLVKKEHLYQEYLKSNLERKYLEQDMAEMDGPRSTANVRVNAYIPEHDALGLPRAYGGRAPFLPTPNGSNMRHYR